MIYDLHTHSTASDGSLSPTQLVQLASTNGVETLALTDHDTTEGIKEAVAAAKDNNINIINGIEFSVTWQDKTIHVVGLNIDIENNDLKAGINHLQTYRLKRAQAISEQLDVQAGIEGALEGAESFSQSSMIGRVHFAQFLVKNGYAKDIKQVFKKYLIKNKPGYVKDTWASLEDVIHWITQAGGIAVIAHPARYQLKLKKLRILVDAFANMGGRAIEVVSGSQCADEIPKMSRLAEEFNLHASIGSDFHSAEMSWNRLGKFPALPLSCKPISELL